MTDPCLNAKPGSKMASLCDCVRRTDTIVKEFDQWQINKRQWESDNQNYLRELDALKAWTTESAKQRASLSVKEYQNWLTNHPQPSEPTAPKRPAFEFSIEPIQCCSQWIDLDTIRATGTDPVKISNVAQQCQIIMGQAANESMKDNTPILPSAQPSLPTLPSTTPKMSTSTLLWIVLAVVVSVGFIAVIVWLLFFRRKPNVLKR